MPLRATPVLAVAVVALGVFLPVFGASLRLVLLADRFLLRRLPVLDPVVRREDLATSELIR